MKVSRKVGRRSRKHTSSSVSRRRLRNKKSKSGYRKKHTQKRGKYGKHGRVHKRARTYKHGKRFHKGGRIYRELVDGKLQVSVEPLGQLRVENIGQNVYTNKRVNGSLPKIENLRYIKGRNTNDVRIDDFYVLINYDKDTDNLDVTLTRVRRPSDIELSFKFSGPSADVLSQILACSGDNYIKNQQDPQVEFGLFKTQSYSGGKDLFLNLYKYIRGEVASINKSNTGTHKVMSENAGVDDLPPGWASTNPSAGGLPLYFKPDDPSFLPTFVRPKLASTSASDKYIPEGESSPIVPENEPEGELVPPAPPASENIRTLPEGWTGHTDYDTGETYYYNSEANKTTWDLPQ
jgi:hypothetical protein